MDNPSCCQKSCGRGTSTFKITHQPHGAQEVTKRSAAPGLKANTFEMASSSRSQRAMWPTTSFRLSDLLRTVGGRPLASAGICGGFYSFSYSPPRGAVVVATGQEHQPRT